MELRATLARRGKKHRELASALGMSAAQLSERMNGRIPWRLDDLYSAADFLGVQLSDIIAAADHAPLDAVSA